jgi:hypothetical protein
MFRLDPNPAPAFFTTEQQIRELVLRTFSDGPREQLLLFTYLAERDWKRLLWWLDTSGLALYWLDRLESLNLEAVLPSWVYRRLRRNRDDNAARMGDMIAESKAIQQEFQAERLSYAVLKGFSLWPRSVPKLELRSQLDLDFLVAATDALKARTVLEKNGYSLKAISGRSWEFIAGSVTSDSLKNLYKTVPYRSAELHLEAPDSPLLDRTEATSFNGIDMPVLSRVDLFLSQGLHVYKHLCSDFSRTAHLLEFGRHILSRRNDAKFWEELELRVEDDRGVCLRLGVATLVMERALSEAAPERYRQWTVERLPVGVRLWAERYGMRAAVSRFPGSKLYLLLEEEMAAAGIPSRRSIRRSLLPLRLPPAIERPKPGERLPDRLRRHKMQTRFILSRLRFHGVEGVRYLWHALLWRLRPASDYEESAHSMTFGKASYRTTK